LLRDNPLYIPIARARSSPLGSHALPRILGICVDERKRGGEKEGKKIDSETHEFNEVRVRADFIVASCWQGYPIKFLIDLCYIDTII